MPDPEGAVSLIELVTKVSDIESLKIDSQYLREQGASLKRRMERIVQSLSDQELGQVRARNREGVMH
jgi:uncharacterized protein